MNLADSRRKTAGSFLFLRIWGFGGFLSSQLPLHRQHCGGSEARSQISPPKLSGFQREREASRLPRHPLDLDNRAHWKNSRKSTKPTWGQELRKLPETPASTAPFLGWPRGTMRVCFARLAVTLCLGLFLRVPHRSHPSFASRSQGQCNVRDTGRLEGGSCLSLGM